MGHSEAVAGEHDLHITDADFQKALEKPGQNPGRSAAEICESGGTVRPAGNPETQKPRHFRGRHSVAEICTSNQLPDQDSNLDKQNQNLLCYRYTIGYRERGGSLVERAGATQEPWISLARRPERANVVARFPA